jgi:polyferredoxin
MGVFGMVRNFFRGLSEIGRENIIALYFISVPAVILATALLFGPFFCGWICPTGALQEWIGRITGGWTRRRKQQGYPFSPLMALIAAGLAGLFVAWVYRLSQTRVFFTEDATIYWTLILILLLFLLAWRQKAWDLPLRRLRVVSFGIVLAGTILGLRITSPVHFGFAKVYDPASLLSTVIVVLAALAVPRIWCRYLCPWREIIGWSSRHSARQLVLDEKKCTRCGVCDAACGVDAITRGKIQSHECHMCLKCADRCPERALELKDRWEKK